MYVTTRHRRKTLLTVKVTCCVVFSATFEGRVSGEEGGVGVGAVFEKLERFVNSLLAREPRKCDVSCR